tara:strand:+ start:305 stop:649 length:345 start_codon:yes stop_codon:yes gene_type:complete
MVNMDWLVKEQTVRNLFVTFMTLFFTSIAIADMINCSNNSGDLVLADRDYASIRYYLHDGRSGKLGGLAVKGDSVSFEMSGKGIIFKVFPGTTHRKGLFTINYQTMKELNCHLP